MSHDAPITSSNSAIVWATDCNVAEPRAEDPL